MWHLVCVKTDLFTEENNTEQSRVLRGTDRYLLRWTPSTQPPTTHSRKAIVCTRLQLREHAHYKLRRLIIEVYRSDHLGGPIVLGTPRRGPSSAGGQWTVRCHTLWLWRRELLVDVCSVQCCFTSTVKFLQWLVTCSFSDLWLVPSVTCELFLQ